MLDWDVRLETAWDDQRYLLLPASHFQNDRALRGLWTWVASIKILPRCNYEHHGGYGWYLWK